jgi:hypothetical protein
MTTFRPFTSAATFSNETGKPTPRSLNNTDVVAPVVKLYIEGVEVRFEAISITQTYKRKPTAEIQIPAESGLMDIIRGYSPKVHVFYEDVNYGGMRLLFWGVITSTSYSRSRMSGSTAISFHCEHKNAVLGQITLDYAGWANPNAPITDNNASGAVGKVPVFNSSFTIIQALAGVNGIATESQRLTPTNTDIKNAPIDKLDPLLAKMEARLSGMPSVAISLWNQIKKAAYADPQNYTAFIKMYFPLLDEGVAFFKRMSGHPYLEARIQKDKQPYCHQGTREEVNVMTPPMFRSPLITASQREMAVRTVAQAVGFSGELTTFEALLEMYYDSVYYDILTLSSPAEVPVDASVITDSPQSQGIEKSVVETIVSPRLPFYFSPTCNVLLPRMYTSIQVNQDESALPTRLTATHDVYAGQSGPNSLNTHFRGPHSVREAVALNSVLQAGFSTGSFTDPGAGRGRGQDIPPLSIGSTKGYSYTLPGMYEQGRGMRPSRIVLPWWLALLSGAATSKTSIEAQEIYPPKGSVEYTEMMLLAADWQKRYARTITEGDGVVQIATVQPAQLRGLNYLDPMNKDVKPFERVLYSMVDYEYGKANASSRSGFIDAVFNPYIVPGYPLDVIDENPNHPSFHGFCTGVTHTITAGSVSTSVSAVAMVTYAELSNYYLPASIPFLNSALSMVNGDVDTEALAAEDYALGDTAPFTNTTSTLIQNPTAKAAADKYYQSVLGVGAVAPDDLIHFGSGRAYPVSRIGGILVPKVIPNTSGLPSYTGHAHEERASDDFSSVVGNLRMVARPIESQVSLASKFGYSFIDYSTLLYNNAFVNYVNPKMAADLFLEPGASLFLDYMTAADFMAAKLSS